MVSGKRLASPSDAYSTMRAVSNRRAWLRGTVLLGAAALYAPTSHAQESVPLPVAVDVVTVASCPAGQFRSALGARVRRAFDIRDDATTRLRVTLVAGPDGAFEGTASFRGASGTAARSVHGTCDDVVAALALVAATWLEAEPSVAPAAPPDATAPQAPEPLPTAPRAAPAPSGAVSTGRAAPPRDVSPEAARPRPRFWLGAHGIATFGNVGKPALGAGLALDHETPRLEWRGTLRGALASDTIRSGTGTATAHYAWVTAALDGCAHALTGAALRVAGCVRVEPGYFHVELPDSGRSLPWLSLGVAARLGARVGPARLELEGDLGLPVTGYRVTRSDATVVPFRALAPGLALGIMVPFR